uniref:Uncharacterized protein n=1 Tax=Anguilla anguilla TaxID=7936 RepID=A0A0E9PEJ4_ANGAN
MCLNDDVSYWVHACSLHHLFINIKKN